MKKMKKMAAFLLTLTMLAALAACGKSESAPENAPDAEQTAPTQEAAPVEEDASTEGDATEGDFDPSEYQLGIVMMLKNHPVHRMVQLGFMKAAKDLGYNDVQVVGTEGTDMNEVYALAEAFATTGGDAALLWYLDESCYPSLKTLKEAGMITGIPHFKFDPIPEGLDFGMACNPEAFGRECADFIAERIEGQTGSIALCQNNKNVTENAATDAFIARMKELNIEGVECLPVELLGADVDSGTNLATAIIQKNDDLIAAFSTMGEGLQIWANASEKSGLTPDDLVIVGMDYTEANLALLNDGKVDALVAQPLYDEAYKTMEYIDTMLRGGTVPEWTDLDAPLVYQGGEDVHDPAYYNSLIEEVKTWFGEE